MSAARSIVKGRALYDFTGKSEMRQLSFKAGDVINITNQYDNGWWAGELNGTVGYLPATYVQLIGTTTIPLPSPDSAAGTRPTSGSVSNGRPPSSYGASTAASNGTGGIPSAPSAASRPTLSSAGSATPPSARPQSGYGATPPQTPPASARPPLGGSTIAQPPSVSRPQATPAAAAGSSISQPPAAPPAASRPPLATPAAAPAPAAAEPVLPTPSYPTRPVAVNNRRGTTLTMRTLSSAERGRAATLRPGASEISDVSEADIAELDQLISKLQNDVSELKKLM